MDQIKRTSLAMSTAFALLPWILPSCRADCPPIQTDLARRAAFYFWQVQEPLPSGADLKAAGATELYVRYFDLVREGGRLRPQAIRAAFAAPDYPIIPVIYIVESSLRHANPAELSHLSENILKLIVRLTPEGTRIEEIQLDCDWTASSRPAFFHLITLLRQDLQSAARNWQISATIRLHQLKYANRTGIPPVDRGLLMLYNTGNLTNWSEPNSILNLQTARSYLSPDSLSKYPLPLDLALPDFRWGLSFVHGSFHRILRELTEGDLNQKGIKRTSENRYECTRPTSLAGVLLPGGTTIRYETVDPCTRMALLTDLTLLKPVEDRRLAIFDYNRMRTGKNQTDLLALFQAAGIR